MTDMNLLKDAQGAASVFLKHDPDLSSSQAVLLKEKIDETFEKAEGTLN